MVRPWKDPWGLSPSLRPGEAWTVLMDLCGRSQPVGPPRSSCDAYVGRICHCHCGGDRRSQAAGAPGIGQRVRWMPTIAARTRDLILYTLTVFTSIYRSYLSVFMGFPRSLGTYYRLCGELGLCGDPEPGVELGRITPPPAAVLGTRYHAWV